jgi:hypothetical protein
VDTSSTENSCVVNPKYSISHIEEIHDCSIAAVNVGFGLQRLKHETSSCASFYNQIKQLYST